MGWWLIRGRDVADLSGVVLVAAGLAALMAAVAYPRHRFLLAIASVLLSLAALEFFAWAWEIALAPPKKQYTYSGDRTDGWLAAHALVGYSFVGPARLQASAYLGSEIIYENVLYSFDSMSRRPCRPAPDAPRHALFFGGSFTFGEGLTNQQTLACQFQTASQGEFASFNYAMMGWGPAQTYNQLNVDELFNDIFQRRGIAVYGLVDDHINRAIWRPEISAVYTDYPFFRVADDGVIEGPLRAVDRPHLRLATDLYGFLDGFSPLFRVAISPSWFRIESKQRATRLTAHALGRSRIRYRERFDGEFFVLLWPRSRLEPDLEHLLIDELTRLGVPVIQVPPLPGDETNATLHPLDGHPSARETAWVAESLLRVIRE
jgi:hypothetical protein